MQSEGQHTQPEGTGADGTGASKCPNCTAIMPREMRFCRSCGFRLGEGVAEFAQTVRLGGAHSARSAASAEPRVANSGLGGLADAGGMAAVSGNPLVDASSPDFERWRKRRKRRRPHWIFLVVLSFMVVSALGTLMRFIPRGIGRSESRIGRGGLSSSGSWLGADRFNAVPEGVSFDVVTPPGGAADKAGLVGGDIISSFDGKSVKEKNQLMEILSSTPVGKTVDVVFIRDGQTRTTKLTTISEGENDKLEDVADRSPDGFLGIDKLERVPIEGTKESGVRVGAARRNRPAYISGMRDGDIVVEFNKVPIRTPAELGARIDRSQPDTTVPVVVIRNGERKELPVVVGIDD
jgi:hypothetical protein